MLRDDPVYGETSERAKDSMQEEYAPLAKLALPIDRVPEDLQKRMVKVFSKH